MTCCLRRHLKFRSFTDTSRASRLQICLIGSVGLLEPELDANRYAYPKATLLRTLIGRYCSIEASRQLGLSTYWIDWLPTSLIPSKDVFNRIDLQIPYEPHNELELVTIGNDVWIGTAAAVMGGVQFEDGSLVGYGSVMTRDVEPCSMVGGVLAELIRPRFKPAVVGQLIVESRWRYDLVHPPPPHSLA